VTFVFVVTPKVVTTQVADVAPAGTVSVAGTGATAASDVVSDTTAPPGGAFPERTTLPEAGLPPTIDPANPLSAWSAAALTVTDAVFVTPA
jgi:hypothetical protein